MTYVISDIHGCYDTFMKVLDRIKFSDNDTLICLGDTIDRGNHNLAVLETFMKTPNMKLIKGNHEYFFECWCNDDLDIRDWMRFGGEITLKELKPKTTDDILDYYNFIVKLPIYIELESFILSHNGFNAQLPFIRHDNGTVDVAETIYAQWALSPYDFIVSSDSYRKIQQTMPDMRVDKRMIIGHVPVARMRTDKIYKGNTFYGIDGGAATIKPNGQLICLNLDNFSEIYEPVAESDIT